jgi:23S rRNA (guanosine2251-2'-O)-methyltransferase
MMAAPKPNRRGAQQGGRSGASGSAASRRGGRPAAARQAGSDGRRGRPSAPPPDTGRGAGRAAAARRELGGDLIEGRQAVRTLLAARRRRVRDVWIADEVEAAPILAEIRDLAEEARVAVRVVPRARLEAEARTEAPQGVLAHAAPLPEADIEVLARTGRQGQPPFLVVLDGVTDPHNLGALLRSAECAGASGVVLPKHRAVHITPTVAKAAAGAIEYLPMALVPGLPNALTVLKKQGVWTVGLDADAPDSLFALELASEPVALVMGAEGKGLSRLVRQRCDLVVSIPQRGATESLNVAAAAAVACFEVLRRRSASPAD